MMPEPLDIVLIQENLRFVQHYRHHAQGYQRGCPTCEFPRCLAVIEALRAALDRNTLRRYHDLSFADPPSYHDEEFASCIRCDEKFFERAFDALALVMSPTDPPG